VDHKFKSRLHFSFKLLCVVSRILQHYIRLVFDLGFCSSRGIKAGFPVTVSHIGLEIRSCNLSSRTLRIRSSYRIDLPRKRTQPAFPSGFGPHFVEICWKPDVTSSGPRPDWRFGVLSIPYFYASSNGSISSRPNIRPRFHLLTRFRSGWSEILDCASASLRLGFTDLRVKIGHIGPHLGVLFVIECLTAILMAE
jgi:hypothetical protein